jgi:choline kinase
MRAIILAAGVASRLRPLTNFTPKCLLSIGEKTILGHTLDNLLSTGITEVVLVTGYRADQIRKFVIDRYPQLKVTFLHNAQFESTNNIYSLWLTRDHVLGADFLLLDSDILFDWRIIPLLASSEKQNCLAVRCDHTLGAEEIKVKTDARGMITAIGKEMNPAEAIGESIGIELFRQVFVKQLFQVLDRMICEEERVNIFYEAAFQEAIDRGAEVAPVDVGVYRCMEIDTADDLARAEKEVLPFLPPHHIFQF